LTEIAIDFKLTGAFDTRVKRPGSFLYTVRISLSASAEAVTGSVIFLFHLFCKDLDVWVRFIPDDKPDAEKKWTVDKVWSVRNGVIRCDGKPNGYIRTVESYANYKLHLEWRWPDKPTNSGVLLHRTGIDRVWPKCVQAQLMHENAGDFWLLNHSTIKVDGKQIGPQDSANAKKKNPSNEKPVGEWNFYDIVCDSETVTLFVNGLLQNKGSDSNPSHGPICLQSEGSPIEFRNVYLEPIPEK